MNKGTSNITSKTNPSSSPLPQSAPLLCHLHDGSTGHGGWSFSALKPPGRPWAPSVLRDPLPSPKQSILSASWSFSPGLPCTKAWNGPPSLGRSPPGCEIRWAETAGGSAGRPHGGGEAERQLMGCTGACGGCLCSGETKPVLTHVSL